MYRYEDLKPTVLTDMGQRRFLRVRDFVQKAFATSGAVRMQEVLTATAGGSDAWEMIACVDRMVELQEIREITQANACGQHRVFVKAD